MMSHNNKPFGLIAAIAILLMAIAAGFAYGYVHSSLISQEPQTTLQNIRSSGFLLHAGVISWLIILILDLVVCWALYHYFKNVHRSLSLLSSGLRLLYSGWLAVAIAQLVYLFPMLLKKPDPTLALQVMQQFEAFESIWSAGLIIFGFHLLALAASSLLSRNIPPIFGWLLAFAGVSYLLVLGGQWLYPEEGFIDQLETFLSLPMAVGELAFAVWLLIRSRHMALPQERVTTRAILRCFT